MTAIDIDHIGPAYQSPHRPELRKWYLVTLPRLNLAAWSKACNDTCQMTVQGASEHEGSHARLEKAARILSMRQQSLAQVASLDHVHNRRIVCKRSIEMFGLAADHRTVYTARARIIYHMASRASYIYQYSVRRPFKVPVVLRSNRWACFSFAFCCRTSHRKLV